MRASELNKRTHRYRGRIPPPKRYYVFFSFGSSRQLRYAIVESPSFEKGERLAVERYGNDVSAVRHAAAGAAYAKAYGFKPLEER
jgi:hypothetical protein